MLSLNRSCFLLVPNKRNKRVLLPGVVHELDGTRAIVRFEEPIHLELGQQATIFAEVRGKFFQQGITVEVLHNGADAAAPLVELTVVGEPVSAESRGSYRVGVAATDLYAQVGRLSACHVVDVSPEGCAVICPRALMIGTVVEVHFEFEGHVASGDMRVQTAKELKNGDLRFGLFAFEKRSALRASLQKISAALQRAQLRRLAGAA
jgi:hypothetical protein